MNPLLVLLVYANVGIVFLYFSLCGSHECNPDFVRRLHRWASDDLLRMLRNGLARICGPRVTRWAGSSYEYCCFKPNPFLQLFYLGLVLGGYVFSFFPDVLPRLNAKFLYWHWFTGNATFVCTLLSFVVASRANPGILTPENAAHCAASYPYDGVIYVEKRCSTCSIARPARSKHCGVCGVCVARFDHHCPWINVCVGERNVRWFLLFLFMTAFMCSYCSVLCGLVAWNFASEHQLFTMMYRDRLTDQVLPLPKLYIFQFLLVQLRTVVPLGLFTFFIAIVIWGFLLYHLWLVCRNTTTNETFKWAEYKQWAGREKKRLREQKLAEGSGDLLSAALPPTPETAAAKAAEAAAATTTAVATAAAATEAATVAAAAAAAAEAEVQTAKKAGKVSSGEEAAAAEAAVASSLAAASAASAAAAVRAAKQAEREVALAQVPLNAENIYNRGILANFEEVAFPLSLRAPPASVQLASSFKAKRH